MRQKRKKEKKEKKKKSGVSGFEPQAYEKKCAFYLLTYRGVDGIASQ
jgi:hypothetical protein